MKKNTALLLTLLAIGSLASIGNLQATQVAGTYSISGDPDNQAVLNGNGSYELTSNSTYSWVDFAFNQPVTFSQLTDLDAVFTANSGAAALGAPRLVVDFSNGGDLVVLLGTSPNYTDSTASLNTYSGVNLIGNNDSGRYDTSNDGLGAGNPFTTYSNALLAQPGLGSLVVTDVAFVLDGGSALNPQDITLGSINASASVPDQGPAWAMLLIGALGLSVYGRASRRRA